MRYQTEIKNKNRGYMNLIVWQKAMDLFDMSWRITHGEVQIDFKLRSQVVDSVQSVAANIAEGYGRRSINEYIQHLYVALGSCAEALTRALSLNRAGQIPDLQICDFDLLHYEVENRLLRLIEKLEQKREDGDWIARISEDPEEYRAEPTTQRSTPPILHHSNSPSLHHSVADHA
jgi:four helix bundle protein